MTYNSLAYRVLQWFVNNPGMPGASVGILIAALGFTSVHQRITELEREFSITFYRYKVGRVPFYALPHSEVPHASDILSASRKAHLGEVAA